MKLERINENQIKCTIHKEDLTVRGLSISELAYGSEGAKSLFREVMSQAFSELGFESDDSPLVVEAIPLPTGSLVLLVTKETDPEELDTRFARFTPESEYFSEDSSDRSFSLPFWEQTKDKAEYEGNEKFVPLPEVLQGQNSEKKKSEETASTTGGPAVKIYNFSSLSAICEISAKINPTFKGNSSVYKDKHRKQYYLVLERDEADKENFNSISTFLSEYSTPLKGNYATLSYIMEHFEAVVKKDAVTILSVL